MLVLSCPQCECSACPPRVPAAAAEPRALQQRCPPGRLPEHTTALHGSERKTKNDEINGRGIGRVSYCCRRLAASPSRSPLCEGGRDGEQLLGMLGQHNPSAAATEGREVV